MSYNLFALYPCPDNADVYGVRFEAVTKFEVPTSDSDYIRVGKEYLDVILDYCVHLASFKMGGAEFNDTQGVYERFLRAAAKHNERLLANAFKFDVLTDKAKREARQRKQEEGSEAAIAA